jgi:ethanolamine utilization protein EutQ (cupin superfamily)
MKMLCYIARAVRRPTSSARVVRESPVLTEFKVFKVDPSAMKPTYIETRCVTMDVAVFAVFNDEPGATTGVEDFRPGDEVEWSFYHDEVQYILKGKAEISYSLPPMHRRWYKTSAEEGCIYLIPRGARVKFKVIGNDPYRHLFVVMPGGFYPPDKFER